MEIEISETLSITSIGKDEAWLQDQIWNNPSSIGLGNLEPVQKEKVVSSGGRLDILLKNPNDDTMYEVEVMLGETDPSHIIRTIEYWDLIKRKWPQRQHYAVLIAEKITRRFFNVIHILSDSVPLIAIQANIVKTGDKLCLHFTKILDVYSEPEDDSGNEQSIVNEDYWKNKSEEALDAAKKVFEFTQPEYENPRIEINRDVLVIMNDRTQMIRISPLKRLPGRIRFDFFHHKNDSIAEAISAVLAEHDLSVETRPKVIRIDLEFSKISDNEDLFLEVAKINKLR